MRNILEIMVLSSSLRLLLAFVYLARTSFLSPETAVIVRSIPVRERACGRVKRALPEVGDRAPLLWRSVHPT
jgi:hypothetical protein